MGSSGSRLGGSRPPPSRLPQHHHRRRRRPSFKRVLSSLFVCGALPSSRHPHEVSPQVLCYMNHFLLYMDFGTSYFRISGFFLVILIFNLKPLESDLHVVHFLIGLYSS